MSRSLMALLALLVIAGRAPSPLSAQTTRPTADALPTAIERLRKDIRGMRPIQVRVAIKARFGNPTRDVGSGIRIPEWDVTGGTLNFHPLRGPTFTTRAGDAHWLLQTKNPARETILSEYGMATPPDPAGHQPQYWIGDVYLAKDSTYRFIDGGTNLNDRGDQSQNFFIAHPAGRVEVQWSKGIKDDTPLESAPDGTIAHVVFRAAGAPASLRCVLTSSISERVLEFVPLHGDWSFRLAGGWASFWPTPPANDSEVEQLISTPP